MAQRIFDIENKKDYADLWDILPDRINYIKLVKNDKYEDFVKEIVIGDDGTIIPQEIIAINWHDKTEIIRPIREAIKQDVGKICAFWNKNIDNIFYGKLLGIDERFNPYKYQASGEWGFMHCRRLTRQEIEKIC